MIIAGKNKEERIRKYLYCPANVRFKLVVHQYPAGGSISIVTPGSFSSNTCSELAVVDPEALCGMGIPQFP